MRKILVFTATFNEIEAIIDWNPSLSDVRSEPYLTVLRLMDGSFMYDEALFIKVNAAVSNQENLFLDASPIYPNPSNGIVNLSFNLESAGDVFVRIYSFFLSYYHNGVQNKYNLPD